MINGTVSISIDRAIEIVEEAECNGVIPITIPKGLSREEKREFIMGLQKKLTTTFQNQNKEYKCQEATRKFTAAKTQISS